MSSLAEKLMEAHPELGVVARATSDPVYAVGGAVRDLLLGRPPGDVDLVVEGDPAALAAAFGVEPVAAHPEFGTLKLELGGREVDVAAARTESYPEPGALPAVELGATIEVDLARRDFTINAMAIPLAPGGELIDGAELIDHHGGHDDLGRRLVRVLHPDSFVDDPTRALRAGRYAARLDFDLETETEVLVRRTDLTTVSPERRLTELRKLAAEPCAPEGFALLAEWGLVDPRPGGIELAAKVVALLRPATPGASARTGSRTAPEEDDVPLTVREADCAIPRALWRQQVVEADAVLAAALGPAARERDLARARPERPSEAVDLARGHDAIELVLARALGAEWLDRYLAEWSAVRLEIDGSDLIAAGVESGPAVGRGLAAALKAKLDDGPASREAELATALAAARQP